MEFEKRAQFARFPRIRAAEGGRKRKERKKIIIDNRAFFAHSPKFSIKVQSLSEERLSSMSEENQ